jgi:type III secretory pathway component EscU
VPGLVFGQIKNYHDKLGMSFKGMYNTFLYVLEVKGLTFEKKYGIGYIKYFYQEGKNYTRKSHNDNPHVKTERRQITIKKQDHRPVVKKIDIMEIDNEQSDR